LKSPVFQLKIETARRGPVGIVIAHAALSSMMLFEQMAVWTVYYLDWISCRFTMIKTTKRVKNNLKGTEAAKPELVQPVITNVALTKPGPVKGNNNHVCLELVKPGAKQVCVAGSFNEWKPEKTPLNPTGNGRWTGDLSVGPGRYEYLFVVDGQWVPDPNAKESVANPFGGTNSVLTVSA
jgi:hypothetical protein